MKRKFPLHLQILSGMILGIVYAYFASKGGWTEFTAHWIEPFGDIFINALKLIAVPLVLFSLVSGIAGLKDVSRLSAMGGKTIGLYLITTVIAVVIGLIVVNVVQPWEMIDPDDLTKLQTDYAQDATTKVANAMQVKDRGPLQFLTDMVPDNIISAATENKNMLQVIVFAVLFGVALILIPQEKALPVLAFFEGVNAVVLKMVDLIMYFAPIGTFALLGSVFGNSQMDLGSLLILLSGYAGTVVLGLLILIVVYMLLLKFLANYPPIKLLKSIAPAQLLAFSTSSSAATLPLTVECVQDRVGISKEVSSFVLPLGATINMDGTSLYQAVAAVFIVHCLGYDLTLADQLSIVVTATFASIGAAAVPGAGMIMLAIVLGQLGVTMNGIALIMGVDRILDMCRTVVNVTGDATVATIIASKRKQLSH